MISSELLGTGHVSQCLANNEKFFSFCDARFYYTLNLKYTKRCYVNTIEQQEKVNKIPEKNKGW